jgi:alkyl sulfatase BDS1-like metallo-beta-lactamase superfamily hydrolase
VVELSNRTLHARPGHRGDGATACVRLTRPQLSALVDASATWAGLAASGDIEATGDPSVLDTIFAAFDTFNMFFPLPEP